MEVIASNVSAMNKINYGNWLNLIWKMITENIHFLDKCQTTLFPRYNKWDIMFIQSLKILLKCNNNSNAMISSNFLIEINFVLKIKKLIKCPNHGKQNINVKCDFNLHRFIPISFLNGFCKTINQRLIKIKLLYILYHQTIKSN